jgi:predicted nucleic acid-binding protein
MMFLDTSGLLCCFDASEARHIRAVELYEAAPRRLTHNYVLAEFVALTQARGLARAPSLAFVGEFPLDPDVKLVWVDRTLHDAAMALLQSQLDKTYSLCDAVSFVLMRQHIMTEALTTDHHFQQAGFQALLRL